MAKEYSGRPSEFADVEDPYDAFCFDEAAMMWGRHIENEVDAAGKKIKNEAMKLMARRNRLLNLLKGPVSEEDPIPKSQFKDPALLFKKKEG